MPSPRRRAPYGAIAAALYMISLAIPAIVVLHKPLLWGAPREEAMFGFQCLLIGWLTIPWFANVALWIAAIGLACRRPGVAAVSSLAAIGLALTTFLYPEVRAAHAGYFAWLASMVVALVAACAEPRRSAHSSSSSSDVAGANPARS